MQRETSINICRLTLRNKGIYSQSSCVYTYISPNHLVS